MIYIFGARGKIIDTKKTIKTVQNFAEEHDIEVQIMNTKLICGKDHLQAAVGHALRAIERGENIGNKFGTELLRYASCSRQVKEAIEKLGIRDGDEFLAIVIFDRRNDKDPAPIESGIESGLLGRLGLARDDSVLAPSESKLVEFGISRTEIETVPKPKIYDLILERIALMDVKKK